LNANSYGELFHQCNYQGFWGHSQHFVKTRFVSDILFQIRYQRDDIGDINDAVFVDVGGGGEEKSGMPETLRVEDEGNEYVAVEGVDDAIGVEVAEEGLDERQNQRYAFGCRIIGGVHGSRNWESHHNQTRC